MASAASDRPTPPPADSDAEDRNARPDPAERLDEVNRNPAPCLADVRAVGLETVRKLTRDDSW